MSSKLKYTLVGCLVAVFAVAQTGAALARGDDDGSRTREASTTTSASPSATSVSPEVKESAKRKADEIREEARKKRDELKAQVKTQKDDARIARCEAKQTQLKEKYASTSGRAEKLIARIDSRLARVQAFVAKKSVTLENSAELLANIEMKKQAAVAAADNLKTVADGFDCKNDDAKAQAALIKTEVEAFKTAVKAYRDAVRDYFKAVVQAFAKSRTESPSPSSTDSGSPSPTTTESPSTTSTITPSPEGAN